MLCVRSTLKLIELKLIQSINLAHSFESPFIDFFCLLLERLVMKKRPLVDNNCLSEEIYANFSTISLGGHGIQL